MSGWVGPGAKTSPQNAAEQEQYKELKHYLQAEEKLAREKENQRRLEAGEKPCE